MKRIYLSALLLGFTAGIGIYASSFRYPWYTLSERQLGALSQRLADKPRDERWREWYAETQKVETPRKTLHDLGVGVAALAAVLAALCLAFGFPLKGSRTPSRRWLFIAVYLLALASQVPASAYYLAHRQSRFEYPPWGDSIVIGLVQTVFGCVLFGILGTLGLLAVLWKATLPANLYAWSSSRPVASVVVTVVFGLFSVLSLMAMPRPVRDGSIGGVLMTSVMLYLFMAARAGIISHQVVKETDSRQRHAGATSESARGPASEASDA